MEHATACVHNRNNPFIAEMVFFILQHVIFLLATWLLCTTSLKTGYGRGLLLLPVLISLTGVEQAVPMLAVAQLAAALPHVRSGLPAVNWRHVGWFLLGAAPCCVAGALVFVVLPQEYAARLAGAVLLLSVLIRHFDVGTAAAMKSHRVGCGIVAGTTSGTVGTTAGLHMRSFQTHHLAPASLLAAFALSGAIMHSLKMMVYQRFIELDWRFWRLAAIVAAAMLLASWRGIVHESASPGFRRTVETGIIIAAAYLLVHGTAP